MLTCAATFSIKEANVFAVIPVILILLSFCILSDTLRLKIRVRERFIAQGWSSGFMKALCRLVEEATFEFSGAGLKKQTPITRG